MIYTRASSAYDPILGTTVGNDVRRRRDLTVSGYGTVQMDLAEGARTNSMLQSEDLSNAVHNKAAVTVIGTQVVRGITLTEMQESSAASVSHSIVQSFTFSASATLTASALVKRGTGSRNFHWMLNRTGASGTAYARTTINLDDGSKLYADANALFTTPTVLVVNLGGGLYYITMTTTTDASTTSVTSSIEFHNATTGYSGRTYTGDGVSSLLIGAIQLELGAFASSYIKTLGSAVTRAADSTQVANTFMFDASDNIISAPNDWSLSSLWTVTNTPTRTYAAGNQWTEIVFSGANTGEIMQICGTTAGQVYKMRVEAYLVSGTPADVGFRIQENSGSFTDLASQSMTTTGTWETIELSATATQVDARLMFVKCSTAATLRVRKAQAMKTSGTLPAYTAPVVREGTVIIAIVPQGWSDAFGGSNPRFFYDERSNYRGFSISSSGGTGCNISRGEGTGTQYHELAVNGYGFVHGSLKTCAMTWFNNAGTLTTNHYRNGEAPTSSTTPTLTYFANPSVFSFDYPGNEPFAYIATFFWNRKLTNTEITNFHNALSLA